MCDPVTIMAVSTIATTAFTGYQQVQQGKYQRGVAEYNAAVAENQAQEVQNKSVEEENIQRRKTAELLSRQRAQLGAANVDLSSGSALQLQEDTMVLGEADAMRIRSNYDAQVSSLQTQADLTRNQGRYAEAAGKTAAVGTLLQGASQVAGMTMGGGAAPRSGSGVSSKWYAPDSSGVAMAGSPVPIGPSGVVGDPLVGVS